MEDSAEIAFPLITLSYITNLCQKEWWNTRKGEICSSTHYKETNLQITFIPLAESHFSLLLKWLEMPHVKMWWDQDVLYTMDLVKEKFEKHTHGIALSRNSNNKTCAYIICFNEEMIGYIQVYNAHYFAHENSLDLSAIPGSICGVDLFIGDSRFLNKGIGTQILNEFEKQILVPHFDWCLIDPAKDNTIAIKAFIKAGFKEFEQSQAKLKTWMIKKVGNFAGD